MAEKGLGVGVNRVVKVEDHWVVGGVGQRRDVCS